MRTTPCRRVWIRKDGTWFGLLDLVLVAFFVLEPWSWVELFHRLLRLQKDWPCRILTPPNSTAPRFLASLCTTHKNHNHGTCCINEHQDYHHHHHHHRARGDSLTPYPPIMIFLIDSMATEWHCWCGEKHYPNTVAVFYLSFIFLSLPQT